MDFLWRSYIGLRPMENYQPMRPITSGAFLDFYEGMGLRFSFSAALPPNLKFVIDK